MRKATWAALAAGLLLGIVGRAPADDAKDVIEKAIKASGGEEKLAQHKAARTKGKGKLSLPDADLPFTVETAWQLPGQIMTKLALDIQGQKLTAVTVLDGDKGWTHLDGKTEPLTGKKLQQAKSDLYLHRVLMLTPLLGDKGFQLSALEETKIFDRPAVGVKVASKGQNDISLWFDKDSGLLVKLERLVYDDESKQDVAQAEYSSDYRDVGGVKTAMKQVWRRDGKKIVEIQYAEVEYPEKVAAAEFARPAGDAPEEPTYTRTQDVVYGHKEGVALTMDVFAPKKDANGAAVVVVVSGGWYSSHDNLPGTAMLYGNELLKRGYTIFAVCHGSQPRFIIPDAVADLNRAVRFIRYHARDYKIDPDRIGITGGSAGGHLSLMQGTAGDLGDPKARDPINRTSSRVRAVACFFPPTDFLNYGGKDKYAFAIDGLLTNFRAAIDVREPDPKTKQLEHVSEEKQKEVARKVSPITHVSADDPPTLIIHGDADKLVPIEQAEAIIEKLKEAGVPAELVRKKGAGHGWAGIDKDVPTLADWFDKHMKARK